jgi:hypothetical protein
MNIYASDEYYMPLMNIIYACDDICDLCEYLRLLEKRKKRKKFFAESKSHCSRRRGHPSLWGVQTFAESRRHSSWRRAPLQLEPNIWLSAKSPPSTRAKYLALGEEPFFNESQISAREWPPLLTEGCAVTVRGPSTSAKDASRRMSAERIQ